MQQIDKQENLLNTAPRICYIVLTATGAGWAIYYCVIIE